MNYLIILIVFMYVCNSVFCLYVSMYILRMNVHVKNPYNI